MSRRLPSLNALRALEATGRLDSVSAAAAELGVSPGAVSRHIALLEAHFGAPLFLRERYGMRLTGRGQILFNAVASAFTGIDEASARLLDAPAEVLIVRCYTSLANEWLVPRIHRFRAAHPGIDLRLRVSLQPPDMSRDDVDLAIVARRTLPSGIAAEPLFPAFYAPVCAPALAATPLGRQQIIYAPRELRMWRAWSALAGLLLDMAGGLELETLSLTYQASRAGAGAALGQLFLVIDDLVAGTLVLPAPTVLNDSFDHVLAYREERRNEPAIAHFREWLNAEAEATNMRVDEFLADREITPRLAP